MTWRRLSLAAGLLSLAAAVPASALELEGLAFMTGHWVGKEDPGYEEVWLAPKAGTITGSFRWVFDNGGQVLEYLVIEEADDGIFFRFKHFGTDYVPWEKDEPNTYRLTAVEGTSATFERVSDNTDVPATLNYRREGDTLTFTGTGDSTEEEPLVLEFTLRR